MEQNNVIELKERCKLLDDYEDTIEMIPVEIDGDSFSVKSRLKLSEALSFAGDVCNSCFDSNGDYRPEVTQFFINLFTIMYYTDIDVGNDVHAQYDVIYSTRGQNIINKITFTVDSGEYNDLLGAIYKRIEYRASSNITRLEAAVVKATDDVESFAESMKDLFDGVSKDDIQKIASAVKNGRFSEKRLVDAYLNKSTTGNNASK